MTTWYCTREQVKAALDVAETARADAQIDRLIEASSRGIEAASRTNRVFRPYYGTERFDCPASWQPGWARLWIDRKAELIEPTAVTSGGRVVDLSAVQLYPRQGPPYSRVELTTGTWTLGDTPQGSIEITGWWGYRDDQTAAGELAASISSSATKIDITDGAAVGVGDLLRIDGERLQVVGRRMLDTGQTLASPVTGTKAETLLAVADASGFSPGELLLIDAERMQVLDVAGGSVLVRRAVDGTVLAGHTLGAAIYAARTLEVRRAQAGTSAAAHAAGAQVWRHDVPGPVAELCIAETLVALGREQSGYARIVGAGDAVRAAPGGDIRDLRDLVCSRYRRHRSGAV